MTRLKNKIFISPKLKTQIEEEKQVVIHCFMTATEYEDAARIWPSTYIIDNSTNIKYPLVFNIGISLYPEWTYIKIGENLEFTLIFRGLPKSCKSFDFIEDIPEPGGFECRKIERNTEDIYYINFQ